MNFKDQLQDDIGGVFLDLAEFGEPHAINGQEMTCIIDEDLSKQRSNRQREEYDGIYARQMTVFVGETDLGYRPERDQKLQVDGEWYLVIDCAADAGMLEITLGANRA